MSRGSGKPGEQFDRDPDLESGIRCIEHGVDWDECGCWCYDDRKCAVCEEWTSGMHEGPQSECGWCGAALLADAEPVS